MAGYDWEADEKRVKSYGQRTNDVIISTDEEVLNIAEYEDGHEEHYYYGSDGSRRVEVYKDSCMEAVIFKLPSINVFNMVKTFARAKIRYEKMRGGSVHG